MNSNKINKYQQQGLSGMAILFLLIILIFGLIIFFKLFPVYMDNMKVVDAMEQLGEDPKIADKMDNQIRDLLLSKFSNKDLGLFSRDELKEKLIITRDSGQVNLTLNYERITPFMSNVSFLVKFENEVQLP
jgi:hypothetical protein